MARPFKIFLIVVAVVLLLVVGAVTAAVMLFDPNDYRDQIARTVKERTGRDLAVGNIGLTFYPWLGADLKEVSLSNAPGFGDEPFARVGSASVGVKLMPLLRDRKMEVSGIALEGLVLNLAKNAEGKTNWEDLAQPADPGQQDSPPAEAEAEASFKLEDIDIGGIAVKNASIRYRDEQTRQAYLIDDFNLETGAMRPGEEFDIETSLKAVLEAQKLNTELKLKAHVVPNLATQQLKVEDLRLETKARNETLDAEAELTGLVSADLKSKLYEISDLKLKAKASGDALPGGSQTVDVSGGLRFDQAAGTFQASKLLLKAAGLEASTELRGEGLNGETPRFRGPLSIAPFNARELLSKFSKEPLVTADPEALKQLSLSAQIDGTSKSLKLDDLVLKLDQTTASGSFAVRDFATTALVFALKVDQIDADRYLPPKEPAREKVQERREQDLNATEIPVEALEKLNVDGTLDIAKLKLRGIDMSEVKLKIEGPKGAAKQVALDAKLYGGQLALDTRVAPGATPSYAIKTSLDAITIGPLLKDFTGKDKVTGLGTIKLDLTSAGKTVGAARQALNGNVALTFQNGAVKGFNLGEMVRRAQSLIRAEQYTPSNEPQETDFAVINFAGNIVNGVLKSDSLDARSPLFRVAGEGEIDLARETFNYLAKPTIVESSKGQGGKGLQDLAGIMIPIRLTGTFSQPKYKVEIEDALKQKGKEKLKEELKGREDELKEKYKVDEKKEELKQKIEEKLGAGALEGLFGRKKKQEPAPPPPAEEEKKEESAPQSP